MGVRLFDRKWLAEQPKEDKEDVGLVILISFVQLVILILALVTEPEDSSYYKVQGGLFLLSVIVIAGFVIVKAAVPTILRDTLRALRRPGEMSLAEVGNALTLVQVAIAIGCLVFLVDYSFVRHRLPIGGAAAVSLAPLVKMLVQTLRSPRQKSRGGSRPRRRASDRG